MKEFWINVYENNRIGGVYHSTELQAIKVAAAMSYMRRAKVIYRIHVRLK